MQRYCKKCEKMLEEKEFYTTHNEEKYPDGRLNICKKCLTMHVDNWEPDTYKPILEEIDIPYIEDKWNNLLAKWLETHDAKKITGVSILGKYISSMKIKPWGGLRWADTERLAEEARLKKMQAMRAQGYSLDEIEEDLKNIKGPVKPRVLLEPLEPAGIPTYEEAEEEVEFSTLITEEEKAMLRLKWGRGYTIELWIKLELLYEDFNRSYDILTAGHKDTLIMVCKTSIKANELLDAGDIEGAQKMTKMYNDLMKSGAFTAVLNKATNGEFVDSIGELVAMCEKDGYIERYYIDKPRDKVDETIEDMLRYTRTLVENETNLSDLLELAAKLIKKEDEEDSKEDDGEIVDDETMSINDIEASISENTVEDYTDFTDFLDNEAESDELLLKSYMGDDF